MAKLWTSWAATLGMALAALSPAFAQTWPQRPITILVQTPPGTLIDTVMRPLARDLSEALGQSVIIDHRVGGGGSVMLKTVANAEPDGYTLGLAAVGPAVIRPLMDPAVGYDFDRDFTPIGMVGDIPNALLVSPKLGINTVQEFVAYAKAHPDLTMGHSGPGTVGHLAGLLFAQAAGIKINFISYRGSGPIITDLMSGQIASGIPGYNPAAKNVKILAVTTDRRIESLPDVPTMAESGYPMVVGNIWHGIVGPAKLPQDIVLKLNTLINAWLNKPGQRAQYSEIGFVLTGGEPSAVFRLAQEDRLRWAAILRTHHITLTPQAQ